MSLLKTLKLSFFLGGSSAFFLEAEGTLVSLASFVSWVYLFYLTSLISCASLASLASLASIVFFAFCSFRAADFCSFSKSLACFCFSLSSCRANFFNLCSSWAAAFFSALYLALIASSSAFFSFKSLLASYCSAFFVICTAVSGLTS